MWVYFDSLQFSFDVGILSIFGHLDREYREKLEENYRIVDKGYNSFPTNIPGTAYHKALQVRTIFCLCRYLKKKKKKHMWSLGWRQFWCSFFYIYIIIRKARKRLNQILGEIICERKEKRLAEKDLLGNLLNFKDEKGQTLSEDQIADNIIGVLFAAQDTTASVITWILKFLHDDPKLLEAVKVIIIELLQVYHHKNRFFSVYNLPKN